MIEELQELRDKYPNAKLVFTIIEDNFDESNAIYTEDYCVSHNRMIKFGNRMVD